MSHRQTTISRRGSDQIGEDERKLVMPAITKAILLTVVSFGLK